MPSKAGGVLVIQHNWEETVSKDEETWAYYKPCNEPSQHGRIGDGNFEIVQKKAHSILLRHVPQDIQIRFVRPFALFKEIHKKSIVSLDVAEGGLAISASVDNELLVWETNDGSVRRNLAGHLFDVYSCRMLPSGVVGVSAGADMQVRIWDAVTGSCPVVLKGHAAAVNGVAVVDKGKNVISVSKDGTARLWNCAQAKCLATLLSVQCSINCCDLAEISHESSESPMEVCDQDNADELEFGTEGKVLALGCEDGKLFLLSVRQRRILATHFFTSSVLSLSWLPSGRLVVGLEDGKIMMVESQAMTAIPTCFAHDSASGVLCVKPLNDGFVAGRKDGICQVYGSSGPSLAHLTGPDCDPVYDVSLDARFIYTACRDAIVRKYKIEDLH